MNTAFLLGSGASIRAGFPSTAELTQAVLSGDGYARHSDGSYYKGPGCYEHAGIPDFHVPHMSRLLRWLSCQLFEYCNERLGRAVNYEDLYYLLEQIHHEELGELDNPFVRDARSHIMPKLCECAKRISRSNGGKESDIRLYDTVQEILNYVAGVVVSELSINNATASYLKFLEDARIESVSHQICVFTLNHDLLVDRFLRDRGIRVIDGFQAPINKVRYWDPRSLCDDNSGCVLLKLHGSINWYRLRLCGGNWYDERIGYRVENQDIDHTTDPQGNPQETMDVGPIVLIGTVNKILAYARGIFPDLFAEFRRRLSAVDAVIVIGYGFGDQGINGQLLHWVYGQRHRRILVIHPKPEELRNAARGAIRNKWDDWRRDGTLRLYESKAECATWSEMSKRIGANR